MKYGRAEYYGSRPWVVVQLGKTLRKSTHAFVTLDTKRRKHHAGRAPSPPRFNSNAEVEKQSMLESNQFVFHFLERGGLLFAPLYFGAVTFLVIGDRGTEYCIGERLCVLFLT